MGQLISIMRYLINSPPEDYNPSVVEWVEPDKVDYNMCQAEGDVALPQSFLQISSVEEGAEWYRVNSKYPDLVCDMLARYEWGDLKYTTPKEFKNMKKKRERKKKPPGPLLHVKRGPFKVEFDN